MTPEYRDAAIAMMDFIDGLSKPMRMLVHEYGISIVSAMIQEGYEDPFELYELLQEWRCRRQTQWLETNFITKKSAESMADAIQRMSARSWRNPS